MKKNFTVSLKEKLAYGMGDFALMIGYGAIGFYFVFFLTDVAGLPAVWAGYIFLIARVWDACIDYAMGFITDATKSRFGRRRPYILFGAIPLGIIFALIWIVPFQSPALLFVYYVSISVLFNTAFTIVSIPYNFVIHFQLKIVTRTKSHQNWMRVVTEALVDALVVISETPCI